MAKVTGLSGNEIYCLALKQYAAGEIVVGNSVNSMGFLGSLGAGFNNLLGGEVSQVTQAIHDGRAAAFARMVDEARGQGASGVAGVTGELRGFQRLDRISLRRLLRARQEWRRQIFHQRGRRTGALLPHGCGL